MAAELYRVGLWEVVNPDSTVIDYQVAIVKSGGLDSEQLQLIRMIAPLDILLDSENLSYPSELLTRALRIALKKDKEVDLSRYSFVYGLMDLRTYAPESCQRLLDAVNELYAIEDNKIRD